jgi:hypothetical protein
VVVATWPGITRLGLVGLSGGSWALVRSPGVALCTDRANRRHHPDCGYDAEALGGAVRSNPPTGSTGRSRIVAAAPFRPSARKYVVRPSDLYQEDDVWTRLQDRARGRHRLPRSIFQGRDHAMMRKIKDRQYFMTQGVEALLRRHKLRGGLATSAIAVAVSIAFLLRGASAGAPQNQSWLTTGQLLTGRSDDTATLLRNGKVLVVGGIDQTGKALASSELFDQQKNAWAAAADMAEARLNHTATLLPDGRVLVVGGFADPPPTSNALRTAEIYDPARNRWMPVASMHASRARQTATLLENGNVLVVGGINEPAPAAASSSAPKSELYDPRSNTWVAISGGAARNGQTASRLPDGRVAVVGGFTEDGCPDPTTQLYDPRLGSWSVAASMKIGRAGHTATPLQGGKILVVGGMGVSVCNSAGGTPVTPLANAELYDSRANTWSDLIPMDVERVQHTATFLGNGLTLVVGTATSTGARAELFDATRRSWLEASGPINRYGHTATALSDGRVLIAGGRGAGTLASSLIFNPRAPVNRPTTDWWVFPVLGLALGLALPLWLTIGRFLRRWWRSRSSDAWDVS